MSLNRLNPGTIIEIDDPVLGGRKLGLVDDTGVGYFDIHGDSELPKPIHANLNPVGLGTITSWASELEGNDYAVYVEVWNQLTARNLDVLTIARAMRWALENRSFDVDLAERMGLAATEKVLKGREYVAASLAN